jgi:hypothetical protein
MSDKLAEAIARCAYAGKVTIGRLRPSEAEAIGWHALTVTGTKVVVPGAGEHMAYSNVNGAISVPGGDGLFGLRPGEFVWVEQSDFTVDHTRWAAVDGEPAWIDYDKPVRRLNRAEWLRLIAPDAPAADG